MEMGPRPGEDFASYMARMRQQQSAAQQTNPFGPQAQPPGAAASPLSPQAMQTAGLGVGATPPAQPTNRLGVSDAALGAMLGTYGDQLEGQELDRQLAEANALRDTALPEGRSTGRTFVAANPLEFVGAGIKQYKGSKAAKELEPKRAENRKTLGQRAKDYGDLIFKKNKDEDGA